MNLSGPEFRWKGTVIEWIAQVIGECITEGIGYLSGFLLEAGINIAVCVIHLIIHCAAGL